MANFFVNVPGSTWVDTVWGFGTWAVGNDGNAGTSISVPKATVDAAVNLANAAGGPHTIYIAPGAYIVAGVAATLDNANHAGLTINGAGRLLVIISTSNSSNVLYHSASDGIVINNLTLRAAAVSGLAFYNNSASTAIILNNCDIISLPGHSTELIRNINGDVIYNKCRLLWSAANKKLYYSFNATNNNTFNYCLAREYGGGVSATSYSGLFSFEIGGTQTFNNCVLMDSIEKAIWSNHAGCTVNINNSIIQGSVLKTVTSPITKSAGVININDSLVLGCPWGPSYTTVDSVNDATTTALLNSNPGFLGSARGGYIIFGVDDTSNYANALDLEDVLDVYDFKGSFYVNSIYVGTGGLCASYAQLQAMHSRGTLEICNHSRTHTAVTYTHALTFTPPGGAANPTVSYDHTTHTWTLDADGAGFDASYVGTAASTLGDVITALNGAGGGWVVELSVTDGQLLTFLSSAVLATSCEDTVAKAAPCDVDFDSVRFLANEVGDGKTELETGIGGTYVCNSFGAPGNGLNDTAITGIIAAGHTGARGIEAALDPDMQTLASFNLFRQWVIGMDTLVGANEAATRANVNAVGVAAAQSGFVVHVYTHTLAKANMEIIVDQFSKISGLTILNHGEFNDLVATGGDWATADNITYTRTYDMVTDNFLKLLPDSPCRDAGVVIAGLTTDFEGKPVPMGSAPDIGAYEFPVPSPMGLTPGLGLGGRIPPRRRRR